LPKACTSAEKALLASSLDAGTRDLFLSGMGISAPRSEKFGMTVPVYTSSVGLVVQDHERDEFERWEDVRERGDALRFAVPDEPQALARGV